MAAQDVVAAFADGYTLLLAANANAVNASLYPNLPFNFVRDIAAVGMICSAPNVLIANPAMLATAKPCGINIAFAKANPDRINMASAGLSARRLISAVRAVAADDRYSAGSRVPYRGGYIADLLSSQVCKSYFRR